MPADHMHPVLVDYALLVSIIQSTAWQVKDFSNIP